MKFSNIENVRKNNSKIENTIFSLFDWLKLLILEPLFTIDDNDQQKLKAFFRIAANPYEKNVTYHRINPMKITDKSRVCHMIRIVLNLSREYHINSENVVG